MKTYISDFVNCNETKTGYICADSERDPLDDLGNTFEEVKYYRLENVVFAEPLNTNLTETGELYYRSDTIKQDNEEESTFIDNITMQKGQSEANNKADDNHGCPFDCPQQPCGRSFNTKRLMRAHLRKVHCADKARFICEYCSMGFPALYLMRRHILTHEGKKVNCPVCSRMLSPRTDMRVHLLSHAGVRNHVCRVCSKQFTRRSVLATHLKSVHRNL